MSSPAKRIIVNTIAQYAKAMVNMVISLYSTRLVIDALSVSDYGVFSVIGSVVALLGFVTNALVITTQRYISYNQSNCKEELKSYFTNSLLLHVAIGLLLILLLLVLKHPIVDGFLNISPERLSTAKQVYTIMTFVLFITLVTAPYRALFIAHENIVFVSVVEVADCIIKLLMVIWLTTLDVDKLLTYSLMLGFMHFCTLLIFALYSLVKYKECCIIIRRSLIKKSYLQQLMGFAGWSTYGMGAVAFRAQGYSFIMNHFFGTVINAAYGIALQVFGAISFLASSIMNAMNPQIMAAEGKGERRKMLHLASQESKFTTTILMIVLLPIIFEIPSILSFWLKEVPPYTSMFCRYILIAFLIDQTTYGLNTANQALGNIRNYTLLIYTPKLLTLPLAWIFLGWGWNVESIMILYLFVETIVAVIRIPFTCHSAGLSAFSFIHDVIIPVTPLCLSIGAACYFVVQFVDVQMRFVLTFLVGALVGCGIAWFFILKKSERQHILQYCRQKLT